MLEGIQGVHTPVDQARVRQLRVAGVAAALEAQMGLLALQYSAYDEQFHNDHRVSDCRWLRT